MVVYVLATLVALFGLLLLLAALLTSHKTGLPRLSQPGLLWWPAIAMFGLSALIVIAPSFFSYTKCQLDCDVIDGQAQAEHAMNVQSEYDACVKNGISEVRRTAVERIKDGANLDVDKEVARAEPGVREVCGDMAVGRCITLCYRPGEGL